MDRMCRPPLGKPCARRRALVAAPVASPNSDISVVRFSACHIVVGPNRLLRRRFPVTARMDAGSPDSKYDTIVTSSGGFNVLVAIDQLFFGTGSRHKS